MAKIVVVSGYYSPIHAGHIEYFRMAKEFAGPDGLVYCIVNSDQQSVLKKGYSFVPEKDRLEVIKAIKYIDHAVLSIDMDRTVCKTLEMMCKDGEFGKPTHFANGGDVTSGSRCPEERVCESFGINLVYGLGDKIQSSSWIIEASIKEAMNHSVG
jgi:D-beta-D-heptose 7-phosphate kinase/D-beta-D-heptose 1-phosphate adenosyltransferase